MKEIINQYLNNHFPKSDLSASLCEIYNDIEIVIQTSLENSDFANSMAVEIFESLFLKENEPIWVLINEWDLNGEDYIIDQFKYLDSSNCEAWISFDTTHEVDREQVFIIQSIGDINYKNILQAITNQENKSRPRINSRIFFINPRTNTYYIYWDSCIYVGADDVLKIKDYYREYFKYISEGNREMFE